MGTGLPPVARIAAVSARTTGSVRGARTAGTLSITCTRCAPAARASSCSSAVQASGSKPTGTRQETSSAAFSRSPRTSTAAGSACSNRGSSPAWRRVSRSRTVCHSRMTTSAAVSAAEEVCALGRTTSTRNRKTPL